MQYAICNMQEVLGNNQSQTTRISQCTILAGDKEKIS